jgi:hypothetical protein
MKKSVERIQQLLRQQASVAHEAELRQALVRLAAAFRDWEHGALDNTTLAQRVEKFLDHARHDLRPRYHTDQLSMPVAHAIATGVVDRSTVPSELLDHLAGAIEFYASEPLR